jgi:hypothetical protein
VPPDTELTELAASRASLYGYHGAVTSWLCLLAMGAMTLGSELTELAASRISLKGYHGAVTSWLSKTESSPQRGRHARKAGCRRTGRIVPSNLVGKPR